MKEMKSQILFVILICLIGFFVFFRETKSIIEVGMILFIACVLTYITLFFIFKYISKKELNEKNKKKSIKIIKKKL